MDFKWKLTRPGIELEFETGSVAECIGLLEQEGTQIAEVFGFTVGAGQGAVRVVTGENSVQVTTIEPKKTRGKAKGADPATAVAPEPLAIPGGLPSTAPPEQAQQTATLPPNALVLPADGGIPPFLQRAETPNAPPALPSPPLAPAPPPVGVLGPKVVEALDIHRAGKADGGQALVDDWLAHPSIGLVIKGQTYDEACRALLMMSDSKLAAVAQHLGVA